MIDVFKMKLNDPVVIIDGDLQGRVGYYYANYPYPDGATQCLIDVVVKNGDLSTSTTQRTLFGVDQVMAINMDNIRAERVFEDKIEEPNGCDFKLGYRVIITKEGNYRGQICIVRNIKPLCGGCLFDYEVEPVNQPEGHPRIALKVREEDLIPADYAKATIDGFDVGRFIDRNTMVNIATEIYEEAIKKHVDTIIERRTFGGTSLTDLILAETAALCVRDLAPKIKDDFLNRIKEEINWHVPKDQDEHGYSFSTMFTSALVSCAETYIKSHPDEINALMVDSIRDAAKALTADKLVSVMSRNIDFNALLKQSITSDSKEGT